MALTLYAGWDHARIGTATIGWNDGSARSASISSGTYAHPDLQSVMGSGSYDDFLTALDTAMDAVSAGNTITFNTSTFTYKLVRGSAWTITSTTNTLMRNILGLALADGSYPLSSTDEGGGVHSISSTRRPHYLVSIAMAGKSQVSDDYEPDGIAEDGEAGSASYGIALSAIPTYHDFSLVMESKEASFTRSAAAAVPWTYQHLFQHARNYEPFSLYDGTNHEVFKLRADGASWRPSRVIADVDSLWDIPFRCRLLGRI